MGKVPWLGLALTLTMGKVPWLGLALTLTMGKVPWLGLALTLTMGKVPSPQCLSSALGSTETLLTRGARVRATPKHPPSDHTT